MRKGKKLDGFAELHHAGNMHQGCPLIVRILFVNLACQVVRTGQLVSKQLVCQTTIGKEGGRRESSTLRL